MDMSVTALPGSHSTALAAGAAAPENCFVADVREELARVVGSAEFDTSQRNRRFLEYVVAESLAGRGNRIKAYNVATEVFGRGVDFDPQLDPVVRMEARRLRRSLERYYLTAGKGSRIRISVPKGKYVPEFRSAAGRDGPSWPSDQSPASESRPRGRQHISVRIEPFVSEGDQSAFLNFGRGLTNGIIIALTHCPGFSVFAGAAADPSGEIARRTEGLLDGGRGDLMLTGSTALFGGVASVKAVLVESRSGKVIWGQTFERNLQGDDLLRVRDEVANVVVQALLLQRGALAGNVAVEAATAGM